MAQKEGEVVVKVDDSNGCSKETIEVNKISRESPCSDYQASSETFMVARSESVRRRNKDLSDQENRQRSSSSDREEVLRCSSNVSFQRGSRDSWRSVISNTKSRLIDPPEEPCQSSERVVNSGRVLEEDKDYEDSDIEDIPQEYKRQKFSKLTLLQWVGLILIIAALVCSLWIPIIKKQTMWDLPLWKWEIVVFSINLWTFSLGLGNSGGCVLYRAQFSSAKKGFVFCLWVKEICSELPLVGSGFGCVA
jgi:hypothetical protein